MTVTLGFILVMLLAGVLSFLASKFASDFGLKTRSVLIGLVVGWIPFVETLQVIGMAGLPSYIFLALGYGFFAFVVAFPIAYFLAKRLEGNAE